jgi:hypothetical protein
MGNGSAFLGIIVAIVAGIALLYGLAMGLIHGILPLWDMAYAAAYLNVAPISTNWLYYTVGELVLVWVLVPLWTLVCSFFIMIGATLMGNGF